MSIAEKFETIADEVYEKGKEDELKSYWGDYQNNGEPTYYAYAFYSAKWTDVMYKPQYDFICRSTVNNMYLQSGVTDTIKPIDITALTSNSSAMFSYSKIKTVRKLIVGEHNTFDKCFQSCSKLENITFEGTIGRSVSFADCPLTINSMKNVIEHLKNYAGTSSEFTYSVTFSSGCLTMLEALDPATDPSPNGNSWTQYLDDIGWLYN